MKFHRPSRARHGFTLVELLVVIAIIAVLASMGFAGAQAAINNAKKTKTRKICVTMDQAVLSFYDEYGHLPAMGDDNADREFVTNNGEGITLLTILLGYETDSNEMENPKKVRFFDAPEAKSRRDGITYRGTGNQIEGLFNPWGGPYYVLLDGNYDEQLDSPFIGGGNPTILRGKRVVTYSFATSRPSEQDQRSGKNAVASWK